MRLDRSPPPPAPVRPSGRTRQRGATRMQAEQLNQFSRDIAHDLRGPLGGIELLAALALRHMEQADLATAQQTLRRIVEQVQAAQGTLDALQRLDGVLPDPPRRQDTDLGVVARAAAETARLAAEAAHPGAALPPVAVQALGFTRTDPSLLHTALVNLIGNAIKFNLDRCGVQVVVRREIAADGAVALSVSDNGAGFDATATDRQAPSARGRGGEGRGLSIVRRAVAHLGGVVQVQSNPGQGATVRFTLGPG